MEYYYLGRTRKYRVRTRVVSATNKNIEDMIEDSLFRKDLYFRLDVLPIVLPPLRERLEDLPLEALLGPDATRFVAGAWLRLEPTPAGPGALVADDASLAGRLRRGLDVLGGDGLPVPGQHGEGDAWSPGWFRIALRGGGEASLVLDAQGDELRQALNIVAARTFDAVGP